MTLNGFYLVLLGFMSIHRSTNIKFRHGFYGDGMHLLCRMDLDVPFSLQPKSKSKKEAAAPPPRGSLKIRLSGDLIFF